MSRNQATYAAAGVVNYYRQLQALQPAEQMLIDRLGNRLSTMKMLDVGVGAGRTTGHFCDRVAEYVGIDNSAQMVEACRGRFLKLNPDCFAVCDARDMGCFADDSFDLVVFSFNGIDYVSHDDRLVILKEIRRVCRPGGIFCFSSHNLAGFERAISLGAQWGWNPVAVYENLVMAGILRVVNWGFRGGGGWAIVRDESHNFRLDTYYVRREEMARQLVDFGAVEVYSWRGGEEIGDGDCWDMWLYYFCWG